MFIDTHCHLNDDAINEAVAIKEYKNAGVDFVINVGYNIASSISAKALAEKESSVYYAVGVHPDSPWEVDDKGIDILKELSANDKCVLIGEIGLDYHYEGYDKTAQKNAFIRQLELADKVGLPVSIHSRDCMGDMLSILVDNKNLLKNGGIMHCFSGSKETAKTLLDMGFYLSFAGTVTFKNAVNVKEVALFTPIDRVLTETDSPYMAPVPFRGQINTPAKVVEVAKTVAEIKGLKVEDFANRVKENAKRLMVKIKD